METIELLPGLIIDNGSSVIKAGFAGAEDPKLQFPSIIAKLRDTTTTTTISTEDGEETSEGSTTASYTKKGAHWVGEEALDKRGMPTITFNWPIKRGLVTDWDDASKMWAFLFKRLNVNLAERPILMSESPLAPKEDRELLAQILFENFATPAMFVANQAMLILYSVGRATGLVVDAGAGSTHVTPVREGHCYTAAAMELEIGGQRITQHLIKLIEDRGTMFSKNPISTFLNAELIKEKVAYVEEDYEGALGGNDPSLYTTYSLPDGQIVKTSKERFQCTEPLFRPSLLNCDSLGVHEMVVSAINECDATLRPDLYSTIVLSGGTSMLPGLSKRLHKELRALAPSFMKLNIETDSDRKIAVWRGGAVLASLSTFEEMWVNSEEYSEFGPSIVHRKCIA